ncbi:hypothetical protein SDC9_26678 [bioreactor metagenome]|jgi:hypothetical protein|uniref:Protein containing Secretin and TonB N terminus short domain n=2 Tax=root TaxID=1 RepID=A0A0S7BY76_9BACT|nr:protein containing Secretin and TonB N terminus short domain [Lentimicrobium saccharophilum]
MLNSKFRNQRYWCDNQCIVFRLVNALFQGKSTLCRKFSSGFIFLSVFFCLTPHVISAQTVRPDEPVTLTVVDEPLSALMERLTRNTGVTFSYNPDQLNTSKTFTLNIVRKPLHEVLDILFNGSGFGYRHTGNQVVIYNLNPEEKREPEVKQNMEEQLPVRVVPTVVRDTVYLTQREFRTDTLTLRDTLVRFDTVFIMRKSPDDRIGKGDIFTDLEALAKEQTREFRVYAGVSLSWLAGRTDFAGSQAFEAKVADYRRFHSDKPLSGSAGVEVQVSYARIAMATGVMFTSFGQNLDYNYQITSGGFFRKDTLDAYFTLSGADTSWFYVMDSTYIPLDLQKYGYNSLIRRNYTEIPLTFQYNFPVAQTLIYFRAGLIAGINSGGKGLYILTDREGAGDIAQLDVRAVVFSGLIGAGVMLPVHKKLIFQSGLLYRRQMQGVYKNFPVDTRYGALGINAGLLYKF